MRALQTCRGCGTRPAEWYISEGGSRDAYEAVIDLCPGCERKQAKEASEEAKHLMPGQFVRLRPRGGRQ